MHMYSVGLGLGKEENMTKRVNVDNTINKLWLLAVGLVVICLLRSAEKFGLKCLADAVEQKEYYMDFLWPAIYSKVSKTTLGLVGVALFIYIDIAMDFRIDMSGRGATIIKNISFVATSVALTFYMLFTMLFMKGYSYWMIFFVVVIFMGIGFTIRNEIIYKRLKCETKKADEEAEEDTDKDADTNVEEDIDDIWKPVLKRLNIMLVGVLVCCFCFFANFKGKVEGAKNLHNELNNEIIRLGFGHKHGMERNRAIVKLQFVNLYNETGTQYSLDVLEKEYENYLNGTGTWSTLWQFCRDSIDVELDVSDIDDKYINMRSEVSDRSYMAEYYLGTESAYEQKTGGDYDVAKDETFGDVKCFVYMVEQNLKGKGLTLHQINDSGAYDRQYSRDFWVVYNSASEEEVYTACEEVYNGVIAPELIIEELNFEISNVDAGSGIKEATVEVDDENAVIADFDFYELERIDGRDYKGDHVSPIDGVLVADKRYMARIILKFPVYAEVDEETLRRAVDGIEEEKIGCAVHKESTCVRVIVDVVFRAK